MLAFDKSERLPSSEQLKAFLAIAQIGSLTLAAGRLNKTQSALSVQIKNLEADFGVPLFARTARGMMLTAYGEKLLPVAQAALQSLESVSGLFADPLTGIVRIGVPDDFEDGRLERVLVDFSRAHPSVELHVSSGCTQGYPRAIEQNALDIAVASGPEFGDGEPLYEDDLVWAAAKGSTARFEPVVPLALVEHGCWFGRLPKSALERAGKPYRIAFSSGSFASVCSSVHAGLAVSMLPERALTSDMCVLGVGEGFPALPKLRRTILRSAAGPTKVLDAISSSLRRLVDLE